MPTEPPKPQPRRKKNRSKRSQATAFFLRGLITLLPAVFTLFIFVVVANFVMTYVTGPINNCIYWSLEYNRLGWTVLDRMAIDPYDAKYFDESLLSSELHQVFKQEGEASESFQELLRINRREHETIFRDLKALAIDAEAFHTDVQSKVHPIFGLGISILLVLTFGYLAGGFFGRRIISRVDQALHRVPLVRSVYPYTKQLVEFFLSDNKIDFDTVVAAPYPSEGIWAIGFVTGNALRTLREETGEDLLSIFIPTSPMPMTGFTIFVRADKVIPLPFSVDEALRITVSGGVLVPPDELVPGEAQPTIQGVLPGALPATDEPDPEEAERASTGRNQPSTGGSRQEEAS